MSELPASLVMAPLVLGLLLRWAVWPWLAVVATGLGVLGGLTVAESDSFLLSVGLSAALLVLCLDWPPPATHRWIAVLVLAVTTVGWWYLASVWPPDGHWPGSSTLVLAVAALALGAAGAGGIGRAAGTSIRWPCLVVTLVAAVGI